MSINISDSGATVKIVFTTAYNIGGVPIDAGEEINIPKSKLTVKADLDYVIIKDGEDQYRILYSDITTPSGGSAVAVKDLIEAFLDTGGGTQSVTEVAATRSVATTMQSAAVANGNGTILNVSGYPVALLNIVSSPAMSGGTTINFEASVDDTTWVSIAAHQIGINGSLTSTAIADGDFRLATAGYKSIRARISAYSAGTITIKGYANPVASQPTVVATSYYSQTLVAAGTAANANLSSGASNISGAPYKYVSLQFNATSLSAADGVIKLQDSIDGTNWSDVTGASITVASGTSVNMIRDTAFTGTYVQAVWAKGSNASGTYGILLMFK